MTESHPADSVTPIPHPPRATTVPDYIVGIGASAGGLEALQVFFTHMPVDSGLAFVVVQHLSPDFKSMMDELLARHTEMSIHRVENGMTIEANAVYLIPPRKEMIVSDGQLLLTDKDLSKGISLPIDVFFRSLAQDAGSRAVAIVLSGTGSDGSRGVVDVHQSGGLVMVQSEESSAFDGMPRSAIRTGVADFVLPPEALPEALLKSLRRIPQTPSLPPVPDGRYGEIFALLNKRYGTDFLFYKPNTVSRRIERRMSMTHSDTMSEYVELVIKEPDELDLLYHDLLIGVTRFFRDQAAFEFLEENVVGEIIRRARESKTVEDAAIRIWIAACATGEEVYSLAMIFADAFRQLPQAPAIKIFATDIHRRSLSHAAAGLYSTEAVQNVSPERRERYFTPEADGYRVTQELRRMVVFAEHNIIKDPPFTRVDLISCRNLLIYFQPFVQKKVLSLFHFALRTSGTMVLGPSETLGDLADEFDIMEGHWKIFAKRRDVRLQPQSLFPMVSHFPGPTTSIHTVRDSAQNEARLTRAYVALLDRFVPPSLIINEQRQLLHTFGAAGTFLRAPTGQFSADILTMVDGDLRMALSAAIQRATREKVTVTYTGVTLPSPEGTRTLNVIVTPLADKAQHQDFLLVSLEEAVQSAPVAACGEPFQVGQESQVRIKDLEHELQHTRENLQATVEELETSNEELQASNEELVASNEELQSTNEELHSVNEELYSVNAEYENKIRELTALSNDMDNLLSSTEIGTLFVDSELRIKRFTSPLARAFNLLPQDLGRPIEHISHNLDDLNLLDDIRSVALRGTPVSREVTARDGDAVFYLRILPYLDELRQVRGAVVTIMDITGLRRTERTLNRETGIRTSLVDCMGEGVLVLDENGAIQLLNPAATEILGHCPVSANYPDWTRDMGFTRLDGKTPIVPAELPMLCALQGNNVSDTEMLLKNSLRPEGVFISVSARPLLGEKEKIEGSVAVLRDVTTRRAAEDALIRARQEAEAASRAKSDFLATMSHEIRTPMNAIINLTAMALRTELTPEQRDYMDTVGQSSEHLLGVINDILDFSKIEAGGLELEEVDFDLHEVIASTTRTMTPRAAEKGLTMRLDIAEGTPRWVKGDPGRLRQVIINLLGNAKKFTEKGGIHLRVRVDRPASGGTSPEMYIATVSVTDTGIGIPASKQRGIFELFSQVDSGTTRRYGGTGLGLTISRRLVEAMGGSITVVSEPGAGSTFSFSVRLAPGEIVVPSKRPEISCACSQGERILVAEDNEINAMVAKTFLGKLGCRAEVVPGGAQVLSALRTAREAGNPFDLVFMDLEMPGMDGFETTQAIRKGAAGIAEMTIPIVAMTAHAVSGFRDRCIEAGMNDYVSKPVNFSTLPETIARALNDKNK